MSQGVLNFTVEATEERLTPRAGLSVFGEFLHSVQFVQLCDHFLPAPGSNRGYTPSTFIQPLILMLHSGGRSLEDLRMISSDSALCHVLEMPHIPTADSTGKWLRRLGKKGREGLQRLNRVLLERFLRDRSNPLVLDIDATVIESHKSIAKTTYKIFPGFTPIVGHLDGYLIHQEFREGNVAPADRNLDFVKACLAQLPEERKIQFLRADSASYQAALLDWCESEKIIYTIAAKLDASVLDQIEGIEKWKPLRQFEGGAHHYEEHVAEFLHTMGKSRQAFRMIVVKKAVTPILHGLESFLSEEELLELSSQRYQVIATNSEEMSPEEVVEFYRKRGDRSENRIKELKNGFNLKYLPTSHFEANALYFQIGALAYNLFVLFKEALQPSWEKHTIQTIRYKLYHIAGKVITHARQTLLKVQSSFVDLLRKIRRRNYEISLE